MNELTLIRSEQEILIELKYKVAAGVKSEALYASLREQNISLKDLPKTSEYIAKLSAVENCNTDSQTVHYKLLRQEAFQQEFDTKFIVYKDDAGNRTPLKRLENNQVSEVSMNEINSVMLALCKRLSLPLHMRAATSAAETCLYASENYLTVMPPSFSLDEIELTFNRIKLELKDGETPTFDSIFSRVKENSDAAKAFIWSIFTISESQQYLWLFGEGEDGKGSLIRLLTKIIGKRACTALESRDDHWTSKLVGKRIGFFNDLTNTFIIQSSTFKQVTGGDEVLITEKYEVAYSTKLDAKLVLTTNVPISMTSRKSDIRRAIYCPIEPKKVDIEHFEEKLYEESPAFLFKCREMYNKLYNSGLKKINCSYDFLKEEAESYETKYSSLYENDIIHGPAVSSSTTVAKFYEHFIWKFQRNAMEYRNFTSYLERTHGIKESRDLVDGKSTRVFKNLRIKSPT